jgi:ribosomal protein L35
VFKRHLLTNRSKKRKRQARQPGIVPPAHHHQIDVLLPYKD